MSLSRKNLRLVLLTLTAAALWLLAGNLDGLQFAPGLPFPGGGSAVPEGLNVPPGPLAPTSAFAWSLAQVILALAFAALLVYLVYSLVKWAGARRLVGIGLGLAVLLALLMVIPGTIAGNPTAWQPEKTIYEAPAATLVVTAPLGQPPQGLALWVGAGLAVLLAAAAGWMLTRARQPEENALARPAEAALEAIRAGQDLSSVILRCYAEMSQALLAGQEIERGEAMTAREFESLLAELGVPAAPVHELTRLFELARYSRQPLGAADEQAALDSLTAITRYCRAAQARPA